MKRNWIEGAFSILFVLVMLVAMTGCATREYLAEATACGQGPECDQLWTDWNKHEDRIAAREAEEAYVRACDEAGGIVLVTGIGATSTKECVSKRYAQEVLNQAMGRY